MLGVFKVQAIQGFPIASGPPPMTTTEPFTKYFTLEEAVKSLPAVQEALKFLLVVSDT